jgi:hypothetical protein
VAYYAGTAKHGCKNEKRCTFTTEHNSFNFAEESARIETENQTQKVNTASNEQATQSTRWMPWRFKPMKDAETGETFEGSCMQALILKYPNGATLPESCLETCI